MAKLRFHRQGFWIGLLSAALCATSLVAVAQETSFAGKEEMNGYKLKDFSGFERKWRLVTVRYRKDTNEMRWTFANDKAWKTLSAGNIEFPDGAVFAKIGIVTHDDPQFPSSAVPSGARRYQIMVRDAKKHQDTGGWGYALFDVSGKTFQEDPKATAMACYACHRIVENRGQVFSQPFQLATYSRPFSSAAFLTSEKGFRTLEFDWFEVSALPEKIRALLPAGTAKVRVIRDQKLRAHLFQGTLDEIRPTLELEAYQKKTPALLVSTDGTRFSLVMPSVKEGCRPDKSFVAISTLPKDSAEPLLRREYCNP